MSPNDLANRPALTCRVLPVLLAIGLASCIAPPAAACWMDFEPKTYVERCPVVITGTIVAVEEGGYQSPRGRFYDVAEIKVVESHHNGLADVDTAQGKIVKALMSSKKNPMRVSTEIRYPVGAAGLWMLVLDARGHFRIDMHPVQKQPAGTWDKIEDGVPVVISGEEDARNTARPTVQQYVDHRNHIPDHARYSMKTVGTVSDIKSLRDALSKLQPGEVLEIAPGTYKGRVDVKDLKGTQKKPIVIRGADPANPPVFTGGTEGWHLSDCSYVTLANIAVTGCEGNGINVDDAGTPKTPSEHIRLRNLTVTKIGPKGNHDGLKLSGMTDFTVYRCEIRGWGGSGIDMVGCRRGLIEHSTLEGLPGHSQASGIQAKGGTRDILIRQNTFRNAGDRAINLGGSTGLEFFRPAVTRYEATAIEVAGNRFIGSQAPIAFVTAQGGHVHHNTFYRPGKWVARILQEQPVDTFDRCADGAFKNNLVVFDSQVRTFVNVGPDTQPKTFTFAHNAWFCTDGQRKVDLPTAETKGVYQVDPKLTGVSEGELTINSADKRLDDVGADAYKPAPPSWEKTPKLQRLPLGLPLPPGGIGD